MADQVHNGFLLPIGTPRSISLFQPDRPRGHFSYCRHITSEQQEKKFIPDRGIVNTYLQKRKTNHYLDATSLELVALYFSVLANIRERREEDRLESETSKSSVLSIKKFPISSR